MAGNTGLFEQAMNDGHSAAWDQRWDRAEELYRKALDEIPDDAQALKSLGLALYELKEFDSALEIYQRAAEVRPNDPIPIEKSAEISERSGKLKEAANFSIKAADLYLNAKDADKALENWARVTRIVPGHLPAHSRLALVHERLGKIPQAITEYIAVASLQQAKGQINEAIASVNHALSLDETSSEATGALEILKSNKTLPKPVHQKGATGPLRMAQVREMEEIESFDKEDIHRDSPDPVSEARQKALTDMAGMLFDVPEEGGDKNGAGGGIKGIAKGVTSSLMSPGPNRKKVSAHLGKAIDYQTRGQDENAAKELKKVVDSGLDHPAVYYNLGLIFSRNDRKETAQRNLQRAVTHSDYSLGARLLIANYLWEKRRLTDAVEEYLEALRIADTTVIQPDKKKELVEIYEPLIEALTQEKDEEVLDKLCQNIEALILRPNWRAHLIETRQQLPDPGDSAPPVPVAEILTQAEGSHIMDAMSIINQMGRQGYFRSAMEQAYTVLDDAPTYLPLHVQMADLLLRQDKVEEAINKFTIVAQAYSTRGESNRAQELYSKIVELSPMDLSARIRLIDQYIARGDIDQGLSEYVNLADVYYRLADMDLARSTYEKALRLAQQSKVEQTWNVQILHHMADIDLQRLDWRKAVRVYEQLRTLDPEDDRARSGLVDLNIRLGQVKQAEAELDNYLSFLTGGAKEEKALSYLENLVEEKPDLVIARQRLAASYQQASRAEEAIVQWDKVAELLYEAGEKEGAKEAIRAILALNSPNADQYRKFLTQLEAETM